MATSLASTAGEVARVELVIVMGVDRVQLEIVWRKSTRCFNGNEDCVIVGFGETVVGIRDSKEPNGPVLWFEQEDWRSFLGLLSQA